MPYINKYEPLKGRWLLRLLILKKGLVTQEGEKGILKIDLSMQGIEPRLPAQMARVLITKLTGHWYV